MKHFTKVIGILVLLIIVIAVIITTNSNSKKKSEGAFSLGMMTWSIGPGAPIGEIAERGADITAGIFGVPLKKEEYSYDPKGAVSAYQALRLSDTKFILTDGSPAAGAVSPSARTDNVLLMVPGATTSSYNDTNANTCRIAIKSESFAKSLFEYATQTYGNDAQLAVLVPKSEYGTSMDQALRNLAAGKKVVINSQLYDPHTTDFRTELTKIEGKQKSYDALLVLNPMGSAGVLFTQMKQLGITLPLLTDSFTFHNPAFDKQVATTMTVADYEYTPELINNDSDEVKEFKTSYKQKYGEYPPLNAALMFDGISVLYEGYKQGEGDPMKAANYLVSKTSGFDGSTGPFVFDSSCEANRSAVLKTFTSSDN
jgi:ABC-type branched-subunit amino acid transport system substrate-binding protein